MASRQGGKKKRTMKLGQATGDRPSSRPTGLAGARRSGLKKSISEDGTANAVEEDDHHEQTCVLCCEEIGIFAKGSCDHVVCFKCSSRMRVLCEQIYCAVCRLDLKKVAFIDKNVPFKELKIAEMKSDRKYGIYFQNDDVKKMYIDLLLNVCPLCKDVSRTVDELRRHVRKNHDKQYCDICLKNLKIFPREFRVYTRSDLVTHRKTGDVDNRSYKGHPQCDFCNERYLDNDVLLLHLRKNHFWCHFCENDGKQEYYENYEDLRSHFGDDHFLCEENECKVEKYTSVFRSEIDFQAHRVARHSKKLSKIAAKQARQLNVDIDYGTRKAFKQRPYSDRRVADSPNSERRGPYNERRAADSPNSERRGYQAAQEQQSTAANGGPNDQHPAGAASSSNNYHDHAVPNGDQDLNPAAATFMPLEPAVPKEEPAAQPLVKLAADTQKEKKVAKESQAAGEAPWSQRQQPVGRNYESSFPALGGGPKGARPRTTAPTKENGAKQFNKVVLPERDNKKSSERPKSASPNVSTRKKPSPEISKPNAPPGMGKQTPVRGTATPVPSKAPPGLIGNNTRASSTASVPPGLSKGQMQQSKAEIKTAVKLQTTGTVQERNMALVTLIRNLLSDENFGKFKDLSGSFRRSEIDAVAYYRCINDLLGNNLELVFNELVELLPDKSKQKELLKLHRVEVMFPTATYGKNEDKIKIERAKAKTKLDEPSTVKPKSAWNAVPTPQAASLKEQQPPVKPKRDSQNPKQNLLNHKPDSKNPKQDSKNSSKDAKNPSQDLKSSNRDFQSMQQDGFYEQFNLILKESTLQGGESKKQKKKKSTDFAVCKECGLTLPRKDLNDHMDTHVDCDYPALPISTKAPNVPSWGKRPVPVHNSWGNLK